MKKLIHTFIPHVTRRYLLLVAAVVWTIAGAILLTRGLLSVLDFPHLLWIKIAGAVASGIVFYIFMFSHISFKHITRMVNMTVEKVPFYAFFNARSYILMGSMITLGITLRLSGLIPIYYLAPFYITMGIPLFLSSFRFYYYTFHYRKAIERFGKTE